MALKAGYKGIKKSFADKLATLLSAKVIKSIGNGLSLSEQGALAAEIDTETMEFKTGKLAAKLPTISPPVDMELLYGSSTYDPVASVNDIDLSSVIDEYDLLVFVFGWTSASTPGGCETGIIPVDLLKKLVYTEPFTTSSPHYVFGVNPHADQWLRVAYNNGTIKLISSGAVGVINIYGIKF